MKKQGLNLPQAGLIFNNDKNKHDGKIISFSQITNLRNAIFDPNCNATEEVLLFDSED
jgi:hypothetical protein